MKNYDYKTAKKMIQMRADLLDSAIFGMCEDWCWTADEIYADGKFLFDLDSEPYIAGICGSSWATPSLMLYYKDGREEIIPCFTGEFESEKPEWFVLSGVSQEIQNKIKVTKTSKLQQGI